MNKRIASCSERLCQALQIREKTAAEVSKMTGITEGLISRYKSGYQEPKRDNLQLISEALKVNPAWLMGFNAPMEDTKDPILLEINGISETLSNDSKTRLLEYAELLKMKETK